MTVKLSQIDDQLYALEFDVSDIKSVDAAIKAKILAQDRANMNEMLSTLTPEEQEQLLTSMEKVEKYLRAG